MRDELLKWYDENKRELPWRTEAPLPYHVLLSEIMLQQTTVTAVKPYFKTFLEKWPTLDALARASDEDVMRAWAGLGYYSRARNLLKAVREIRALGGFPEERAALQKLSGVGEYTSAAIASIAFGEAVLPIDGNVKRVIARLYALDDPIDKPSLALKERAREWAGAHRPGDVAQAFMDLGATLCRPRSPRCEDCPLQSECLAYQRREVENYPKRTPKAPKKIWQGQAYVIETPQGIVFEKREAGLLKGMDGLPSQMGEEAEFDPPFEANWQDFGTIEHVFTHIHLTLNLWYTQREILPASNSWYVLDAQAQKQTASLWRKALEKTKNEYDRTNLTPS